MLIATIPTYQNVKQSTLRDGDSNPCMSHYPVAKLFWWTLLEGDYEKAAKVVTDRINWRRGGWCLGIQKGVFDSNCAQLSQVGCIMNAYYNEVMALAIPEYDPSNLSASNKTPARIASETEQIITHTVKVSGQAYFRVKEVLEHLYWATYGDTADRLSYQYISPLKYKANREKIQKPEDYGSGVDAASDAVSGTFDGIITAGKWLLIAGAVGVGIYFLWPVISSIKSK